jgi:hypothetical protein
MSNTQNNFFKEELVFICFKNTFIVLFLSLFYWYRLLKQCIVAWCSEYSQVLNKCKYRLGNQRTILSCTVVKSLAILKDQNLVLLMVIAIIFFQIFLQILIFLILNQLLFAIIKKKK